MNIAAQLPSPLNTFVIDVPANQYYDFELSPDSTYPLRGVTYPVDYGNVPGYTTEDGKELDLFVGTKLEGKTGYILVDRGDIAPSEHKFYVGLTSEEVSAILEQLKPVLIDRASFKDAAQLLLAIAKYKDN